jgi:hypothetical protein
MLNKHLSGIFLLKQSLKKITYFVFSSLVTNMGQLELEEEMLESQLEELQVLF